MESLLSSGKRPWVASVHNVAISTLIDASMDSTILMLK